MYGKVSVTDRQVCAFTAQTVRKHGDGRLAPLASGGFSWADKHVIFARIAEFGGIAMGGRLWYNELVYRNRTGSWQEPAESNCRPFGCRQGGAFII